MILHDPHPASRCRPIEPKPDPGTVPDTHPKGRRCVGENKHGTRCITRLNQFHPGRLCYVHEQTRLDHALAELASLN